MGNKESQIATTTLLRDKLKENVARITWLALNNISGTRQTQNNRLALKINFHFIMYKRQRKVALVFRDSLS